MRRVDVEQMLQLHVPSLTTRGGSAPADQPPGKWRGLIVVGRALRRARRGPRAMTLRMQLHLDRLFARSPHPRAVDVTAARHHCVPALRLGFLMRVDSPHSPSMSQSTPVGRT